MFRAQNFKQPGKEPETVLKAMQGIGCTYREYSTASLQRRRTFIHQRSIEATEHTQKTLKCSSLHISSLT